MEHPTIVLEWLLKYKFTLTFISTWTFRSKLLYAWKCTYEKRTNPLCGRQKSGRQSFLIAHFFFKGLCAFFLNMEGFMCLIGHVVLKNECMFYDICYPILPFLFFSIFKYFYQAFLCYIWFLISLMHFSCSLFLYNHIFSLKTH